MAKLSPTGSQLWATYLGESNEDCGYGIAIDSAGNALVTGYTNSTNFQGAGNANHDLYDAFVAKIGYDPAWVAGRYVFYNNSYWDDPTSGPQFDDSAAIVDKAALLPDQAAIFANYTSYDKGLNGIMVDVEGRPVGSLTAADFEFFVGNSGDLASWTPAPEPLSIDVFPDMGIGGSDRVTIIWDDNAIENQWLQITVKANDNTGLAQPDIFYFGNAVRDAGNQPGNAIVNATDEIMARNFYHGVLDPAAIDDPYDHNRDGLVNGTDQIIAWGNQTNPLTMLRLITAPAVENPSSRHRLRPAGAIAGGTQLALRASANEPSHRQANQPR